MTIFIRPSMYWIPAALPFLGLGRTIFPKHIPLERLSAFKAGLLRDWRTLLARSNDARATSAQYFSRTLALPLAHASAHPYLRLPVVVSSSRERDRIYLQSTKRGLGVSLAYPTPVDEIPDMRGVCSGRRFPTARRDADNLLTIPTHHWLSDKDKRAIADLCRGLSAA